MRSRQVFGSWLATVAWLTLAAACSGGPAVPADGFSGLCIDRDGDGYGLQCSAGPDCNDSDPSLHNDCPAGTGGNMTGAPCEMDSAPLRCIPELKVGASGALICKEGMRYCRDGAWTECEGAATFQIPAPRDGQNVAEYVERYVDDYVDKILPDGAGSSALSDCFKNIFPVEDPLDIVDGGLTDANSEDIEWADGGGIRNAAIPNDIQLPCDPSSDLDCDGIPDDYDPFDSEPPFQTHNPAIFLDLEPGESEDERVEISFQLGGVDVYFLLDTTSSMATTLDSLQEQLTSGNYIVDNPDTTLVDESAQDCEDIDFDGTPDNDLKNDGIIGNIKCLIGEAYTGAGWFRQVPFSPNYSGSGADGDLYGDFEEFAYEHYQDIADDPAATRAAIASFETSATGVSPEAWASALYSVASQGELYFGWNRSAVPQRVDCGSSAGEHANYSGWPCFRELTVPVVVMITDATSFNGPDTRGDALLSNASGAGNVDLDYDTSFLTLDPGNDVNYHPVPYHTNEDFLTAKPDGDVGAIDTLWETQWGNTREMTADIPASMVCDAGDAPDAVFAFNVPADDWYTFNSRGTRFMHSMALFADDGTVIADPDGTFTYDSDPSNQVDPLELGTIVPGGGRVVNGDNDMWADGFAREMFTQCFHFNTANDQGNGSDKAPWSEFVFEVSEAMTLDFSSFSTDSGNDAFNVAMALYAGEPLEPTDCTVGVDCDGANSPDLAGDVHLGVIDGTAVRVLGPDTTGEGAEMPDTLFVSFQGDDPDGDCEDSNGNPLTGTSNDHYYDFTVNAATTVAIETSGNDVALTTGWNEAIGLLRVVSPTPISQMDAPGNKTSGAPTIDGDLIVDAWYQYSGDFTSLTAEMTNGSLGLTSCGGNTPAADTEPDAFYAFKITADGTYEFNTIGSSADTELVLVDLSNSNQLTSYNLTVNDADGGEGTADAWVLDDDGTGTDDDSDLANDEYLVSQDITGRGDDLKITGDDARDSSSCQVDVPNKAPGEVYAFTVPMGEAITVTVEAVGSGGFEPVVALFDDSSPNPAEQACARATYGNANPADNRDAEFSFAIAADNTTDRTFYVAVEGDDGTTGSYDLRVADANATSGYTIEACDIGSAGSDAEFTVDLVAGSYGIMVKGSGGTGEYVLNILNADDDLIECAFHNLVSNQAGEATSKLRSYIEADLDPGEYRVVVRGHGASGAPQDAGNYKLIVKDLSAAPNSVACHNDSLGFDTDFEADVVPGIEYHLIMRGHESSDSDGSGNYQVVIGTGERTSVTCGSSTALKPWVEIEEYLLAGNYFAVIKGQTVDGLPEKGWYQITMGDPDNAITTPESYLNHNWDGTSGNSIEQAIKQSDIRVLTLGVSGADSDINAEVQAQLEEVSVLTNALDENGKPLTSMVSSSDISADSSTILGETIMDGVSVLSDQLAMDIGLDIADSPTNPGFGFAYTPVDVEGDGCSGIDLVKGLHLDCRPGATPRFTATFTNPAEPGHVPLNPDPAQDGYDLILNLLGRTHCEEMYDGSSDSDVLTACGCNDNDGDTSNDCKIYLADQVPVFIVPVDVVPEIYYEEVGLYWQDFGSPGCVDTELPDWDTLHYDATLPFDTSLKFEVCTASDPADLSGCTYSEIATVTLDSSCASVADCACTADTDCSTGNGFADNGYCVGNLCHVMKSPSDSCSSDPDCGVQGACDTGSGVCTWSHDPGPDSSLASTDITDLSGTPVIDVGAMLRNASMNGLPEARMRLTLYASDDQGSAPIVHTWSLLYNCLPGE